MSPISDADIGNAFFSFPLILNQQPPLSFYESFSLILKMNKFNGNNDSSNFLVYRVFLPENLILKDSDYLFLSIIYFEY